jgi:hypothetical protein
MLYFESKFVTLKNLRFFSYLWPNMLSLHYSLCYQLTFIFSHIYNDTDFYIANFHKHVFHKKKLS